MSEWMLLPDVDGVWEVDAGGGQTLWVRVERVGMGLYSWVPGRFVKQYGSGKTYLSVGHKALRRWAWRKLETPEVWDPRWEDPSYDGEEAK